MRSKSSIEVACEDERCVGLCPGVDEGLKELVGGYGVVWAGCGIVSSVIVDDVKFDVGSKKTNKHVLVGVGLDCNMFRKECLFRLGLLCVGVKLVEVW